MKRFILSTAVALGALFASAETTMTYGICDDAITGVGTGYSGTNYSAAIEVPEAVAKALEGSKVTTISVGFASGLSKIVNVYLTYDLAGEPFYTQEGRVKVNSFNDQVLDTPYVIEGRRFYIGYTYRQSSATGKPIGFDNNNLGGMSAFSNIAIWPDGGKAEWQDGSQFGALSIRATITGDKTIDNCLIPVGLQLPQSLNLGKEFSYTLDVLNFSTQPVNSLGVSSTFGGETPITYSEDLATPLAPGQRTSLTLNASCSEENATLPITVSIPTVNGKENLWSMTPATASIICSNLISPRTIVIEEATGTQCSWCPAGYVAMEMMRENHPENYIGIAVHNYTGDPMACVSYEPWVTRHINGFPNATINRSPQVGTFSPQPTACEARYNELVGVLNLRFVMEAEYTDDTKTKARIATYLVLGTDEENLNYGIALVETEDNVGPYIQANGYAGGSRGEMYGWEKKESYVSTIYNDVARAIYNWQGKEGSVPREVKSRTIYTYEETVPLQTQLDKHGDMHLIALLIDRSTGEIVTGAKCVPDRITSPEEAIGPLPENSSVSEAVAPSFRISAVNGALAVEGEFDAADIFSLDGRRAASLSAPGSVNLNAGLYIVSVKANGQTKTSKIIIK